MHIYIYCNLVEGQAAFFNKCCPSTWCEGWNGDRKTARVINIGLKQHQIHYLCKWEPATLFSVMASYKQILDILFRAFLTLLFFFSCK